jgi:hypothetical protein
MADATAAHQPGIAPERWALPMRMDPCERLSSDGTAVVVRSPLAPPRHATATGERRSVLALAVFLGRRRQGGGRRAGRVGRAGRHPRRQRAARVAVPSHASVPEPGRAGHAAGRGRRGAGAWPPRWYWTDRLPPATPQTTARRRASLAWRAWALCQCHSAQPVPFCSAERSSSAWDVGDAGEDLDPFLATCWRPTNARSGCTGCSQWYSGMQEVTRASGVAWWVLIWPAGWTLWGTTMRQPCPVRHNRDRLGRRDP